MSTSTEGREAVTFAALHQANIERQAAWCPDQMPDLSFRGNELAGETGEACNVIKKLERARQGWAGSRVTVEHLAEELADVVICADLCAITAGVDLGAAVVAKFNATSEKVGLPQRLAAAPSHAVPAPAGEAVREAQTEREARYAATVTKFKEEAGDDTDPASVLAFIEQWTADTFPVDEQGQVHFGRAMLGMAADALRVALTPAPDADLLREARRHRLSGVSLPVAKALVELFGGEDTDMTVELIADGHSGSGFYAWCTEYPEDGSDFLGPHFDVSELAALAQPAESASGEAVADPLASRLRQVASDMRRMRAASIEASELEKAASRLEALQRDKEEAERAFEGQRAIALNEEAKRELRDARIAELQAALASAEKRAEEAEAVLALRSGATWQEVDALHSRIAELQASLANAAEPTPAMVNAAWNAGKHRRMTGSASDFADVLKAALTARGVQS